MTSSSLRQTMRQQRNQLSPAEQLAAAQQLYSHFKKINLADVQHIAAYFAFDGEIDPIFIIQHCWNNNLNCYLPVIQKESHTLEFRSYPTQTTCENLSQNHYQILEPDASQALIHPEDIQLILLPLTAFDKQGHRLGMGKGYYDNTLRHLNKKPYLIGLGHHFQCVDNITPHTGDVALDAVLTDKDYLIFNSIPLF